MKNLFLLILLLFITSCDNQSSGTESSTTTETSTNPVVGQTAENWTEEFMDLINNHRQSIGLRALIHDVALAEIVTAHSKDMASGSVAFGHDGFSARCSASRQALGGGNWCGENVAMGQKTPQAAFTAWMNSPGHRANIEQSRATHTGFGFAKSSSGTYYWTQIFLEL